MAGIKIDTEQLEAFERGIDTRRPGRSRIPTNTLGFGEMSAVLEFETVPEYQGFVFKRMPIFHTFDEARDYERLCREYIEIATSGAGIRIPETEFLSVRARSDLIVFYAVQKKLPGDLIGSRLLHRVSDECIFVLLELVLGEMSKVKEFNRSQDGEVEVTLDFQLSNWALETDNPDEPEITADSRLDYIDITTPLMRRNGKEQIDPEYLMRGSPEFLRGLLRRFAVDDVMNRYYDARESIIDIIANCIKENREDLIPGMVERTNEFLQNHEWSSKLKPITIKDVYHYYRVDAGIWIAYLESKKIDRFFKTKIWRKPYDFILPGKFRRNFPLRNKPRRRDTVARKNK